MNSEIYINPILKKLELPSFKCCLEERRDMIWIDNETQYHTLKMTTKWCQEFRLLHILPSVQSSDLNPIENIWHIIKIKISAQRHWIHSLEEMEKVIQEKWDKLMEKNSCKCIETMPKCCKLVILARNGSIKYYYLVIKVGCSYFIEKFEKTITKFLWGLAQ